MSLDIVILASGAGKRMKSSVPKVLHLLSGIPLISHVVRTAYQLNPDNIIVVKDSKVNMMQYLKDYDCIKYINQDQKLGTGHAVQVAFSFIKSEKVLVLYADTPMISVNTLYRLIQFMDDKEADISLLTFVPNEDHMYGRVVINKNGFVDNILEYGEKGYEILPQEVFLANSGVSLFRKDILEKHLFEIDNSNSRKEYYLTDIVKITTRNRGLVVNINIDINEACGVNRPKELVNVDKILQIQIKEKFMNQGVVFIDHSTVYIAADAEIENDVVIYPNTYIGTGVKIQKDSRIYSFSHLENTTVKQNSIVGPYACIKGKSVLEKNSYIGCFVEINRSIIGEGSKVKHLSYIGDVIIGDVCNIGAGTVFCNYDGVSKHVTKLGNSVFIGANNSIVSPVVIGDNVKTGASSIIRRNLPDGYFFVTKQVEYIKVKKVSFIK